MASAATSGSAQDSKTITLKRPVSEAAIAEQDAGLQISVPDGWTAELKQPETAANTQKTILLQRFKTKNGLSVPVYLLSGGGDEVRKSVNNWTGQFTDGAQEKTEETRSAIIPPQKRYVFVDVSGNFKGASEPLLNHNGSVENGRLLGAIIGVPDSGIYVISIVGPKDKVDAEYAAFRSSFGALAEESENDIDLSQDPETAGTEKTGN